MSGYYDPAAVAARKTNSAAGWKGLAIVLGLILGGIALNSCSPDDVVCDPHGACYDVETGE